MTRPLVVLFAIPPVLAMLVAAPMALAIWINPGGPTLTQLLLVGPFYLGIICAPGYARAVMTQSKARERPLGERWWLRLSLSLALVCGLAGLVGGYWMFLFAPPSLATLALTAYLFYRFEGRGT